MEIVNFKLTTIIDLQLCKESTSINNYALQQQIHFEANRYLALLQCYVESYRYIYLVQSGIFYSVEQLMHIERTRHSFKAADAKASFAL